MKGEWSWMQIVKISLFTGFGLLATWWGYLIYHELQVIVYVLNGLSSAVR